MAKSRNIAIVHSGCEDSSKFSTGDRHVEIATSSWGAEYYDFDHVFPSKTPQEKIFHEVARGPVLDALQSFTSTVFLTFGPTGCGKTFAITGGAKRFADRGLIPRSISALFEALGARTDREDFEVAVTFYEIYKEGVVDLLSERRRRVAVQHFEGQAPMLEGLLRQTAATESDAYHLLFQGDSNRHFERFPANPETSRGHVFYILHLTHLPSGRESTLSFIDLAAVISTRNHATAAIERSLDALKVAAATICAGEQPVFDGQILTQLLQPLLQPDMHTMAPQLTVICPIRYTEQTAKEVHQWLEFARQLREAFATAANGSILLSEAPIEEAQQTQVYADNDQSIGLEHMSDAGYSPSPVIQQVALDSPVRGEAPCAGSGQTASEFGTCAALSPIQGSADLANLAAQDPMSLHRELYTYQPPVAESPQAMHDFGFSAASQPLQPSQCPWQALSDEKDSEYGPGMPMWGHQAAVTPTAPQVSGWSPQTACFRHGNEDLSMDARTASDVTSPPQGQNDSLSSAVNGSVVLAQSPGSGVAARREAAGFAAGGFHSFGPPVIESFPQVNTFSPAPMFPPAVQVVPSIAEDDSSAARTSQLIPSSSSYSVPSSDPRTVMRAPYLFPNSSSQTANIGDAGAAQRMQESLPPVLPWTALPSTGSGGTPTSSYPGTLCVAPASASPFISSSAEVDAHVPSVTANSGSTTPKPLFVASSGPPTPKPVRLSQGSRASAEAPTAPVVMPLNIKSMPSQYAVPHAVPGRSQTPTSAAHARKQQGAENGSLVAPIFVAESVTGVPTPLRAGQSQIGQVMTTPGRPGPARMSSYVGPTGPARMHSPAPRSPAPRSPCSPTEFAAPPGSPCASRANSPLSHRYEVVGSARTNVYGPSTHQSSQPAAAVRGITPPPACSSRWHQQQMAPTEPPPAADGRFQRSLSPLPGQQPLAMLPPSGAGAAWQFQANRGADSMLVIPGAQAPVPTVRYARVSSPLPRSLSPQPGGHHRGGSAAVPQLGGSPQPGVHHRGGSAAVPQMGGSTMAPLGSSARTPLGGSAMLPVAVMGLTGETTMPPLPNVSMPGSSRTAGMSQRSLTPGARRHSRGDYSPQPRASQCHMGPAMSELQAQQLGSAPSVPWASGGGRVTGDGDAHAMSGTMNSFILTRPCSLSSSGKAAEFSAIAAPTLKLQSTEMPFRPETTRPPRASVSPQPSRSGSPMPGSPMHGHPHPQLSNTPLIIAHRGHQQPPVLIA